MLSQNLEKTVRRAVRLARDFSHEYATLEHLLLALIEDDESRAVLEACNVDMNRLQQELRQFLQEHLATTRKKTDILPTLAFQRALQRAVNHILSSESTDDVRGPHVLAALFSERESHALYFLRCQNVSRLDVVHYIAHGGTTRPRPSPATSLLTRRENRTENSTKDEKNEQDPVKKWCIDLNQRAEDGKIDPLIGRTAEMRRIIHILSRRVKNNPLLIGDPGVGKTAIAEGLATRIVEAKVPEHLANARIHTLDLGSLLAGTRYRGDFEERVKSIIEAFKSRDNPILFIDEIHTLVGAGATSGGAMDGSNLLKPALSEGLRCIGATTYKEYRHYLEKDRALIRRFQKVDIEEPNTEDTVRILHGLKQAYEKHHHVTYSDQAIRSAVILSQRYINDRKLPDKAIDVIDEAGAVQRVLPENKRKKRISTRDIEKMIADIARIPPRRVASGDTDKLRDLEISMKNVIFGQDEALHALTSAVKLSRVDLRDPEKPIGCYLFAGPTGVGKTEASRQLAQHLDITLNRFDMSEYMESHSLSRLIGAPPGYVGFEQGGLLTDAIEQNPHCVLLLDEIEKAHADIFNILLQIMDYGFLTDHNGKKINCQNTILIMTTNAGAQQLTKAAVGFARHSRSGEESEEIERIFPPEFRNRLDAVIHFASLNPDAIARIFDKQMNKLADQLRPKRIALSLTPEAQDWLIEKGYDSLYGARPLQRLIQEKLKKPMADEILFGKLTQGGTVHISLREDVLHFDITSRSNANKSRPGKTPKHGKAPLHDKAPPNGKAQLNGAKPNGSAKPTPTKRTRHKVPVS